MDIARCQILFKIRNQETIPVDLLARFLDNKENIIVEVSNLFLDSPINELPFNQLYNYILDFCKVFFILYPYAEKESLWLEFYLLLRAFHEPDDNNVVSIINTYQNLPLLRTKKIEIQWVKYQVETQMLSYYMYNKRDYTPIVKKLEQIPQEIKDLHY